MENILNILGLAKRAGKLISGTRLCEEAVKRRKARLVVIAVDASENAKKAITDCCLYYKTEFIEVGTKADIGSILGMGDCAAAAVTDENFAVGIKKKFMI